MAATAVANALVLGSFVRDRGVKKQKWKVGSVSETMERSISVRGTVARAWGSDEDLVRDLGLGVDLELRHHRHISNVPRPAPKAISSAESGGLRYPRDLSIQRTLSTMSSGKGKRGLSQKSRDWNFPIDDERDFHQRNNEDGDNSDDFDLLREGRRRSDEDQDLPSMITPRKVSFFDVGGLLESGNEISPTTRTATSSSSGFPFSPKNNGEAPKFERKGSAAFLPDLGGLITPLSPTVTSNRSRDGIMNNPLISRSSTNWSSSPFSFNSLGGQSRAHLSNRGGDDVFVDGDIQMRRLDSRRDDSLRGKRGGRGNGELRDVGGLLE